MRFLTDEEMANLDLSHFVDVNSGKPVVPTRKSQFGQALKCIFASALKGVFRIIFRIGSTILKIAGTLLFLGFPVGILGFYKDYIAIKTRIVSWQHIFGYMYTSLPLFFIVLPVGLLVASAVFNVLANLLESRMKYSQNFTGEK